MHPRRKQSEFLGECARQTGLQRTFGATVRGLRVRVGHEITASGRVDLGHDCTAPPTNTRLAVDGDLSAAVT
jgi:hypothetical protein